MGYLYNWKLDRVHKERRLADAEFRESEEWQWWLQEKMKRHKLFVDTIVKVRGGVEIMGKKKKIEWYRDISKDELKLLNLLYEDYSVLSDFEEEVYRRLLEEATWLVGIHPCDTYMWSWTDCYPFMKTKPKYLIEKYQGAVEQVFHDRWSYAIFQKDLEREKAPAIHRMPPRTTPY